MRFWPSHTLLSRRLRRLPLAAAAFALAVQPLVGQQQSGGDQQEGFRFHSGVELINVNATVTDSSGRFVPGLQKDDFRVFEDNEPQTVTHFSNERVPVSLGIAVDTSGSMAGEKMQAAQDALNRFLDLLGDQDEFFLYRFGNHPILVNDWTSDRRALGRAISRLNPQGGTAMYDTVAEAVQLAQTGRHTKKALVIISDGNDTNSSTNVRELKQLIRESEVLVYAIGIDGRTEPSWTSGPPRMPVPFPIPIPGRRGPFSFPPIGGGRGGSGRGGVASRGDERVNVSALRELTDDSGGRTEVVRSARDLDPATAGVASELSQQYYLGYPAQGAKDGRWHSIKVEVRNQAYVVRARRGYVAS
jgi:Ca-activated chloride channel family protein